jgi:Zn-dependent peptidase ImmA (M78 family)
MEHIWRRVDELREEFEILRENCTPIDVFTFLELDLGLDPISFDGLVNKYRVDAAIKADFTGIYLDAKQYALMEEGPEWKLNRFRFTVAHELAHYFLHKEIPQKEHFSSLLDFAIWTEHYAGRKYTIEQEANEFAGRLLVPETRLKEYFEMFASEIEKIMPIFMESGQIRDKFADQVSEKFGVNSQVINIRLDRDLLWPAS